MATTAVKATRARVTTLAAALSEPKVAAGVLLSCEAVGVRVILGSGEDPATFEILSRENEPWASVAEADELLAPGATFAPRASGSPRF